MIYWLTIFFLLPGYGWVAGDNIDGWGSIPYATEAECGTAKASVEAFAADTKAANPQAYEVRVVCTGVGGTPI